MFRSGLPLCLFAPSPSFETFQIFRIPLKAATVAIHKNRLIAVCGNAVKVFSFDSAMSLRPIHSYNMTFALSMCAYLPSSVLPLAYKILLNLLNNGTQLAVAEAQLCVLMDTLDFSRVCRVTYSSGCITLHYRDGTVRCFDSNMDEISPQTPTQELVVRTSGRSVEVWLDTVLLLKRHLGHVSSSHRDGRVILLQKSDTLIAIVNSS